jgi:signal transduction histidine kinase
MCGNEHPFLPELLILPRRLPVPLNRSPQSREMYLNMHRFLSNNRDELIARCKAKVALRPQRAATKEQLGNGIPLFLAQLIRTLQAEDDDEPGASLRISGATGGDATALSEMGVSATAHGKQLLQLGFSVDQVVHDYGDLCQAITDLAVERDAPFSVDQFRTLNRCLDNAIADAVTGFVVQRDATVAVQQSAEVTQKLGSLAHELRNSLQTATMAFTALESGQLSIAGSTGALLKRSLVTLSALVTRSLVEVRAAAGEPQKQELFALSALVAEAKDAASLDASSRGCDFVVMPVDSLLAIKGDRDRLLSAVTNLLQNAFKFTQSHTEVMLNAYAAGDHVFIEVRDHCGGLSAGTVDTMFTPFTQRSTDKSGLGLGLSIAKRNVEADGGTLTVHDRPGTGCVLTMRLPRHELR